MWRPKNSPETYEGEIRVRLALALSKNVIAVRLLRFVGLSNMIDHLALFGFAPNELPKNESLALGSASLTPLELVTGFATFANGGYLVEPYLIERIEDSFGNVLYQSNSALACDDCEELLSIQSENDTEKDLTDSAEILDQEASMAALLDNFSSEDPALSDDPLADDDDEATLKKAKRVITEQNAFLIQQALNSAIWGADWNTKPYWQGTGFRGRTLKRRDISGKTGTTNQAKDAWFSGFSRRLVTTSWIGFDDHKRRLGITRYNNNLTSNQIIGSEFGAKSAQPAWISFMAKALPDLKEEAFVPPEDIVSVRIDKATGKLSSKADRSSEFEYFILGTEPQEYSSEDNSEAILENNQPIESEGIF